MNKIPLNNRRARVLSFCLLLLLGWLVTPGQAHQDTQTHARLSVASFLFLDQASPSDGVLFPMPARSLARQGSINEDNTPLYFNHFFNPKTYQTIDIPFYAEVIAPERASNLWNQAIQQYRSGQTDGAFDSLGHVLHLLQDMTSPAHVHLDDHGDPRSFVPGSGVPCEGDTDDFENWGYCPDYGINAIFQYVTYTDIANSQILPPLGLGLARIFGNQPQRSTRLGAEKNTAYAFVRDLANKVYDFTSFYVILEDTPSLQNDLGAGELKTMFPSLIESGTGWTIDNIGFSAGDCANIQDQAWWMMNDQTCHNDSCGFLCKRVSGYVYIENTGGGSGTGSDIPDNLKPKSYDRPWFRLRYNIPAANPALNTNTMLRIYGDVLYAAAVAHGAGLLQAFLDEAIMPKPVTQKPTQVAANSAQLNGSVQPAGEAASAWFEWGPDTDYGSVTPLLNAGSGSAATNLNARLDGLQPDSDYQYRIVSSNRFGLRYGTNQVFRTSKEFLVTGDLPNAWQITDHSTTSTLNYTRNLSAPDQQAATNNGWRYTITSRMVDDFGGTKTMTFLYQVSASKRFLVWWDLDSDGNLTAEMEGQPVQVVAANGSASYHTHEIRYTNGTTATYLVDGAVIGTWPGASVSLQSAGEVFWGSGSSAGMGQMNFRDVEFQITTVGTVASYHAGVAGNPVPNPMTQGWALNPAKLQSPNAVTPISGETDPYLSTVETLPATEVRVIDARLNGRADPRGEAAVGWFEWGDSLSYGNITQPQELGDGFGWTNANEHILGLLSDQTYHFRFVASNEFAVVFGGDETLVAARLVIILAKEVPAPGQFHLQFAGTPGTAYEVERSTDLSAWTAVGEGAVISLGVFEFLDVAVPPAGAYYRVRSLPAAP